MRVQNSREYSRVNTYLPLEARLVPSEERAALNARVLKAGIVIDTAKPPEVDDKVLSEWLNVLNDKMDSIIEILSSGRESMSRMTFEPLNISANGMRITCCSNYDIGDVLEIKIALPMRPYKILYLYGEVIRIEPNLDRFNVAVKFIGMNEEVRNELLKFDFKKHREVLSAERCI